MFIMSSIEHNKVEFSGKLIRQRLSDGYLNATDMCKANGKLYADWKRLGSTNEYLKALSSDMGTTVSDLVQIKKGGKADQQGTWIHPYVATNLAQWISPKFSIKVSQWIGEWRKYSQENENKFMEAMNTLEPSASAKREKEIQYRLRDQLNAEIEVKTPVGNIDLLTSDTVIEIKEYSKWKHAIGQVICYGLHYKNKQKKIILFGSGDMDEVIRETCTTLGIELDILE